MKLFLMRAQKGHRRSRQAGFSLIEMILASAVLMVGIVSVVQLVPVSLSLNAANRLDTLATVIAQRELDQMLSQPLYVDSFTDQDFNIVSLGGAGSPGAPVVMQGQTPVIDFTAGRVDGFYLSNYVEPHDPTGAKFELRWAVMPERDASNVHLVSKRIIIGCRQTNAIQPMLPVNLDSWVQK
jgi:prepilin-type N-terminal cleavage/methylation domain-containing protein